MKREPYRLKCPMTPVTHLMKTLSYPVLIIILFQQRGVVGTLQHSQQPLLPLWHKHINTCQDLLFKHPPPKTLKPLTFSGVREQTNCHSHIVRMKWIHFKLKDYPSPFPSALGRWSFSSSFLNRRPHSKSTWALEHKAHKQSSGLLH